VTAAQLREVAGRLARAGAWRPGDRDIIVVLDCGYDVIRLAWLLADLPLVLCARLRSNRVFCAPPAPRPAGMGGPPRQHGAPLRSADPATWAAPPVTGQASTARYGTVQVAAWNRMHARLCKDTAWEHHPGTLPVIEGTLIQLRPARLPRAQADVAMGLRPRRGPRRDRRAVAGVPAPLRHRDEQAAVLS
jgi:hypothetical protein